MYTNNKCVQTLNMYIQTSSFIILEQVLITRLLTLIITTKTSLSVPTPMRLVKRKAITQTVDVLTSIYKSLTSKLSNVKWKTGKLPCCAAAGRFSCDASDAGWGAGWGASWGASWGAVWAAASDAVMVTDMSTFGGGAPS